MAQRMDLLTLHEMAMAMAVPKLIPWLTAWLLLNMMNPPGVLVFTLASAGECSDGVRGCFFQLQVTGNKLNIARLV
jgi:hypothetical protein